MYYTPPNLSLKAEIKSTLLILQTAKESSKGKVPLSEINTLLSLKIFGKAKVWVALGKSLPEFVYFAVEICHCGPLPSATAGFLLWQKFCEPAKHQRRHSAWVGQADFQQVEPKNGNHSGNCQRLSA